MIDLSIPPATIEYLEGFYNRAFKPLIEGHSVAINGVPKSGVRSFAKYFSELKSSEILPFFNADLFSQAKFHFIDLTEDPQFDLLTRELTEDKSKGNLNLIIVNNTQLLLKDNEITNKVQSHLISLYNINAVGIKFLFIFNGESDSTQILKFITLFGISSITFTPLREESDMLTLIEKEEKWFDFKLPTEAKERITKLSGGYSALARALLKLAQDNNFQFIKKTDQDIAKVSEISNLFANLFDSLSEHSKKCLFMYTLGLDITKVGVTDYLYYCKILYRKGNLFSTFSPLMKIWLKEYLINSFDISEPNKKGEIFRSGINVKSILSSQEFLALKLLVKERGEIVSRESIAKVIWFDQWSEVYSDYAIDNLISRLRKKLLLTNDALKSIKGKGVMLVDN